MASTALLAAVAFALASSSPAAADGCPSTDDGYTSNCGPTFAVPSWTDAGGWSDPSQYSTIQLADFNGDGRDELLGRSDAGLEIYRFDTTLGQWRPQVDASGVPQLLSEFTSFLPSSESNPANPNQAKFYSTIQAADIDGQPGEEILARFQDGMHVYQYTPPAGGNGIDGGSWRRFFGGPFGDAAGLRRRLAVLDDRGRAVQARRSAAAVRAQAQQWLPGRATRVLQVGWRGVGQGGDAIRLRGLFLRLHRFQLLTAIVLSEPAGLQPRARRPGQ